MESITKLLTISLMALVLTPAIGRTDNNPGGDGLGYQAASDMTGYDGRDHGAYDVVSMLRGIKLADEQKALIDGILNLNKEALQKAADKLKLGKANMYDQLRSGGGDDDIRKRCKELEAMQNEIAEMRLDNMLAIRTVLTPEQRRQLQAPEESMGGRQEQGARKPGHETGGGKGRGRGGMGGGRGGTGVGW
jgi:Spy/CpxP family protein refolding chaperone